MFTTMAPACKNNGQFFDVFCCCFVNAVKGFVISSVLVLGGGGVDSGRVPFTRAAAK